jgi:hypothetical protein
MTLEFMNTFLKWQKNNSLTSEGDDQYYVGNWLCARGYWVFKLSTASFLLFFSALLLPCFHFAWLFILLMNRFVLACFLLALFKPDHPLVHINSDRIL